MTTHPIEPEDESLLVLMHEGYTILLLCALLSTMYIISFFIDLLFIASSLLHDLDFMDGICSHSHMRAHNLFRKHTQIDTAHTPQSHCISLTPADCCRWSL